MEHGRATVGLVAEGFLAYPSLEPNAHVDCPALLCSMGCGVLSCPEG